MSLMGNLFRSKVEQVSAPPASPAVKIPAPLGLTPGSVWTPGAVDLALAQADGSILVPPVGDQIVSHVGGVRLFGVDVYNIYLQGTETFLQAVCPANNVQSVNQLRLFTLYQNVVASTLDDVEFWLGKLNRDSQGNVVRDAWGNSQIVESGLIGWPLFQVDSDPPIIYQRNWTPGTEPIAPVSYQEKFSNGIIVKHEACEYVRRLKDTNEYLLAVLTSKPSCMTIDIYVGIDLDIQTQQILAI